MENITIQIALISSGAALFGALIGAIIGIWSTSKQISAQNNRTDKTHLFNARKETYEEFIYFINKLFITRFQGGGTRVEEVAGKDRDDGARIIAKLVLYSNLSKEAQILLSFFDKPISSSPTDIDKDKEHIKEQKAILIKKMRQEFDLGLNTLS